MNKLKIWVLWLLLLFLNNLVWAQDPDTSMLSKEKFLILGESEGASAQVLECPNHLFGSMDDGEKELKKRLRQLSPGQISFIQLCISDQLESVKRYTPMVDIISINPYVNVSSLKPKLDTLLWAGVDHPMINQVRLIRELAGNKRVWARIGIGGVESEYITKRSPTFEEIKWMIYATIGANYKGYVWVGLFDSGGRLRRLMASLLSYSDELGAANPVDWVKNTGKQPVSATSSSKYLFVILLNSQYFQDADKKILIPLPLDLENQRGEVVISPPQGVDIVSGTTLTGIPLKLDAQNKKVTTHYSFTSGGEILIFKLSDRNTTTFPASKPVLQEFHP